MPCGDGGPSIAGSIVSVGEALIEGCSLVDDMDVEVLGRRTPSRRNEATIFVVGNEGRWRSLLNGTEGPTLGCPARTITLGGGRMRLYTA